MEVDDISNSSSGCDSTSVSPAEQLKTRLSAGGDTDDTRMCNGDSKRVNGQNGGSHDDDDEEPMDTDDVNNGDDNDDDNDSKNGEDETDSPVSRNKEDDSENSNDSSESAVKSNGTDSKHDQLKDSESSVASVDSKVNNKDEDDSKSSADDNKENVDTEMKEEPDKKLDSTSASSAATPTPDEDKESTNDSGSIDKGAIERELEKELKKPTAEEIQQAAEVDQREKKLKRMEEAAKDNDDLRPVAKLLYGIGMDLGAQHIYKDLVRAQTKKESNNKLDKRGKEQLGKLKETYQKLIKRNKAYQLKARACDKCGFKTESKNVIEWHLEFAHGQDEGKYECSFCDFETRLPAPFFFHMEAEHSRKGRVFMKKAFFSCPQCPYENNSKNAITRHRLKCDKQFGLKRNQEPLPTDCDIPLKKPRSITTKRVQPAVKPPNMANAQLKGFLANSPQQGVRPNTSVIRVGNPNPTVQSILSQQQARAQMMNQPRARLVTPGAGVRQQAQIGGQMYTLVNPLMVQQMPQAYTTLLPQQQQQQQVRPGQQQSMQFMQQSNPATNISQIAQQVVAQVTQQHSAAQQQKAIQDILKRAQQVPTSSQATSRPASPAQRPGMQMTDAQAQAAAANNPKFEICEICGGFVKDRESLRIHFYWAHKVDIQKDVFARLNPHLKCDSCPQSFWTYQGLARHRQISHVKPRERSYRCYLCGAKNIENIITHLSAMHNVKLNTMYKTGKCLVCGLGFAGEKGLKRHIHTAHLELLKGNPEMAGGLATAGTGPASSPSPSKPIPMMKAGNKPGAAPVPTGLFENAAKKKKFEPVCSLCNIVFPSVESFTLHCNKLHVFKCWRCPDKWASSELLHKHWNEKHRTEMDPCPLCNEKITIGRPMVRHMRRSHLKECSTVLVRMKPEKVDFYMKRLEELEQKMAAKKKAAAPTPKDSDVIVLESDEEEEDDNDVQEVVKKSTRPGPSSSKGGAQKSPVKANPNASPAKPKPADTNAYRSKEPVEKEGKKDEASPEKPVLKSGDHEVMEIDGEKIVVSVSKDEDDEAAGSRNDKDENGEEDS